MAYARKRDLAHAQIVAELRDAGFSVLDLANVGKGCPDLLIGRNGVTALVEIKTPKGRKTAAERLRAVQAAWAEAWKGTRVIAACTTADVIFNFSLLCKRTSSWR